MKTEQQIRDLIETTIRENQYVLNAYPASYQINGPRALMQVAVKVKLDALYEILDENRPLFNCDNDTKIDH